MDYSLITEFCVMEKYLSKQQMLFYPIECLFRIFKNSNLLITSTFHFLREYKIDRQIVNHCTISV
jgi:hypothetical protein